MSAVGGLLAAWPRPVLARVDDGGLHSFCAGSPELCVFTCGDWPSCNLPAPGGSEGGGGGFICESRRGELIVAEGSEETTYETDYAFCWYQPPVSSGEPDDPRDRPDPEREWVPPYEPEEPEQALCGACEVQARQCRALFASASDVCIEEFTNGYYERCTTWLRQDGHTRDRHERPIRAEDKCAEMSDEEDPFDSRRDRAACRNRLIHACIEDREIDHPEDTSTNTQSFDLEQTVSLAKLAELEASLGTEIGRAIRWGSSVGFRSACNTAAHEILYACIAQKRQCRQRVDPRRLCER